MVLPKEFSCLILPHVRLSVLPKSQVLFDGFSFAFNTIFLFNLF